MARISYDDSTAAAYKEAREIPREGLLEWRGAFRRHVRPTPATTLLDVGAGTGQFASAFSSWFGIRVVAVEPSAAMRERIPRTPAIRVVEGDARALPLPRRTPRGSRSSSTTFRISTPQRARSDASSAPARRC